MALSKRERERECVCVSGFACKAPCGARKKASKPGLSQGEPHVFFITLLRPKKERKKRGTVRVMSKN